MTDEIQECLAEAELGIQIQNFISTDVGRYLIGCRDQDENDATDKLLNLDAFQYSTLGELQSAITKIQQDILTAKKVHGYLSDAIIRGNQAEEILSTIEDE